MKKNKKILWIFLLILGYSFNVKAVEGIVSMDCDVTKVPVGGQTVCHVKYTVTSGSLKGFGANITTNGVNVTSVTKADGWEGTPTNSKIGVYTANPKTGTVPIVTINVTVTSATNPSITLTNIDLADENDGSKKENNSSAYFTIPSDNNGISQLTVDGVDVLNSRTYTTNNSSVTIVVVKNDDNATVSGDGTRNLNCGLNNVDVSVTSESNIRADYPLKITRNCSSDSTLKSLSVGNENISITSGNLEYSKNVASNVSSVKVQAVANDSKATISGDANKDISLSFGSNILNIIVTAEDGSTSNYKVVVNRVDNRDGDNTLASLTIKGVDLEFDKDTNTYNLSVESDVDSIEISAKATSNKATVSGDLGKKELIPGSNRFVIVVTAENEATNEYTIVVIRKDESGNLDKENTLKELTIEGVDFEFDENTLNYTINLEEMTNKLNITAIAASEKALVTIKGNNNLKPGKNKIVIEVLSESGDIKKYVITVNLPDSRDSEDEKALPVAGKGDGGLNLWFIIIPVAVILLIVLVLIILKKRKKGKEEVSDIEEEAVSPIEPVPNAPINQTVVPESVNLSLNEDTTVPEVLEDTPTIVEENNVNNYAQPPINTSNSEINNNPQPIHEEKKQLIIED